MGRSSVKTEGNSKRNGSAGRRIHFADAKEEEGRLSVDLLPSVAHDGSINLQYAGAGSPTRINPNNYYLRDSASKKSSIQFGPEANMGFYAPVLEDATVEAKVKIKDLQGQLVKMKSDKNVLEITVKHLKTELDSKSNLVRRQTDELSMLRETVLELQR